MQILEQFTMPKSPSTKTEDGIVITDDFVAVIDGSTSKTAKRISRWRSNGRYCMQLIAKYIKKAPKTATAEQFCHGVTAYIAKHYKQSQIDRLRQHPEERLTASVIVYSRLQRQVWMIGDCQCLIGDKLYENAKPYEQALSERRAAIAHQLLASGEQTVEALRQNDVARQAILPQMIEEMKGQNIDYAVVDGFPIPMSHVKIVTLDFRPWTIVLASDGYPFLKPTLEESEAALKEQAEGDPLNISTFKATKAFAIGNNSFDDRSYVKISV